MCGRFTLTTPSEHIEDYYGVTGTGVLKPRYNIAPTQAIMALRFDKIFQQPKWCLLRWGFIPSWMKEEDISSKFINARSETVADKPMFRSAFARRRCVIPASGFYEWRTLKSGKQPFYISTRGQEVFSIAGLWESWERDGVRIDSCTLLTMPASDSLQEVHSRMPVILNREQHHAWIDPKISSHDVIQQATKDILKNLYYYPVSRAVNNPKHDHADCIVKVGE